MTSPFTSSAGPAAVIGAGSWGTALSVQLGRSGIAVRLLPTNTSALLFCISSDSCSIR